MQIYLLSANHCLCVVQNHSLFILMKVVLSRRGLFRMATLRKPFMIGVAGGTASGKSTVCDLLMEKLGQNEINIVEKQASISFYFCKLF